MKEDGDICVLVGSWVIGDGLIQRSYIGMSCSYSVLECDLLIT